jgi:inorganic pyrophosphatase
VTLRLTALRPSANKAIRFGKAGQPEPTVHFPGHAIHDVPLYTEKNQLNAVIEIPAGTRAKFEANLKNGQIEHEIKKGKPRYVDYLGYPTMYGFLPQTVGQDDADPLDALILGDNVSRGTVVPGKVIGAIKMIDGGEQDYKYLVVPKNSHFEHVSSLGDLPKGILGILSTWFTHYKQNDTIQIEGQLSASDAKQHIAEAHQRWKKQQNGTKPTLQWQANA